MAKLIEYIGAAVISALPAIAGSYVNLAKEPQLKPSANPATIVWSYPGEYQKRNFMDVKPFGSLDEVVLRTQDGKVVTLRPGEKGFDQQEEVYQTKIIPLFGR